MPYSVKILADSIAPNGKRLTTWELQYPRFVHSEVLTHRLFSRNSASSRAIPTAKLMEQVRNDPAMPKWWGKNQPGMQAREEFTNIADRRQLEEMWLAARDEALAHVQRLGDFGLHKQIANRILEPWMFITVIVSATEFDNWFRLRCHPDAQPEIGWVAKEMKAQYDAATPGGLRAGDWHLPLVEPGDWHVCSLSGDYEMLKKVSVARCARVSYLTHDGRRDYEEDIKLHDRLAQSGHWSPFEHVAQAMDRAPLNVAPGVTIQAPGWSGNFCGWRQYRETMDPNFTTVGR